MDCHRKWFLIGFVLASGCSRVTTTSELPVASSLILDELVVYSDFKLPDNHRLLADLELLREEITDQLALPVSDEQVQVYIFKTPRRYRKFLKQHYPAFPSRRAFFVETDTRLSVYTYWGDRIAEDLRHEVCHGYLHAVVPKVPLWLDEGLAEYFEHDRGQLGLHRAHLEQLLAARDANDWQPDLARLERFEEMTQLAQMDYAESWLWTHFLLRSTPIRKQILCDYLLECRRGPRMPLSERLQQIEPAAPQQLLAHLNSMRSQDALFQDDSGVTLLEPGRLE
jgi:hypothetical protein